ncbi:MAG: endonuclease [Paludibacteraceae bacterium]
MKKNKQYLTTLLLALSFLCEAAIPTGYYYQLRGKNKSQLKSALSEVSSPMTVLDYGSGEGFTWQGFYKTDRNEDNTVKDMYSTIVRSFNGYKSIDGMAIEHSFPKSWWGGYENMAYKDLFNLYPADSYTNGIKNNLPLGEVAGTPILDNGKSRIGKNGFETTYTDNSFEPADEFKGDFARSYMYMASVYENLASLWNSPMLMNTAYPAWKPWAINLLLKWSRQDPVSDKERARNDSIYTIQSNRNPFIDHPELAEYIWGNDTTYIFDYPIEEGSFLIAPRRQTKLDFGVLFINTTKTIKLNIQGVNITSSVSVSLSKKSSPFSLSSDVIIPADIHTGYEIQINYAPLTTGQILDTLIINGGGLSEVTRVPLSGIATSEFIVTEPSDVTPVGGTLHWIEDPQATDYKVSLYQGDTKAGDLIISGYYEGASNDKAIEIYNGTGAVVNLANYSLKKQTNGAGEYVVSYKLSGTLQNNQTYIVVNNAATNADLKAKASAFTDSVCAFNGNDAIALFRNGVPVDIVGKLGGGADYMWGLDKILKRNTDVTHPNMHFNLSEWTEFPYTSIEKMGSHSINFATQSSYILQNVSIGKTTSYSVNNINPNQKYTYKVTSMRSNVAINSVNTQQLKTESLEAPMALDATELNPTNFMANWSESSYAQEYAFDLMKLSGNVVTDTEGFDIVIGTTGKPLPAGWTATASGSYNTTASSGAAIPSMQLKNSGEWLQTPVYSDIITKLSFMYRFPSSATGSYLKIEAQNTSGWTKIDSISYAGSTSKYFPTYSLSPNAAYTTVRFTYTKVAGNLALDDISIMHGKVDTVFVTKDYPVSALQYKVENLNEDNTYYYRVRANYGNSYSDYSNVIKVVILKTGVKQNRDNTYKIGGGKNSITVFNLSGSEVIKLYSITGSLLNRIQVCSNTVSIPLVCAGIYLLEIDNGEGREVYKAIR